MNDSIKIKLGDSGTGFATGDPVIYHKTGDGADIEGLTDGETYYVIVSGPNTIQLAQTEGGSPVDLTVSGALISSHSLTAIPIFSTFVTATGTSSPPEITITNTFDADAPHPYEEDVRTSEIEILGDINNILGPVTITSVGSIMVQASINAGGLAITSEKGNFVMSYTDSMFHVGGNPGGLEGYGWDNVARYWENKTETNTTITTYHKPMMRWSPRRRRPPRSTSRCRASRRGSRSWPRRSPSCRSWRAPSRRRRRRASGTSASSRSSARSSRSRASATRSRTVFVPCPGYTINAG